MGLEQKKESYHLNKREIKGLFKMHSASYYLERAWNPDDPDLLIWCDELPSLLDIDVFLSRVGLYGYRISDITLPDIESLLKTFSENQHYAKHYGVIQAVCIQSEVSWSWFSIYALGDRVLIKPDMIEITLAMQESREILLRHYS